MKTKKVVGKIFDAINYSKKLKDKFRFTRSRFRLCDSLELEDGSKFEIIIIPTSRFV